MVWIQIAGFPTALGINRLRLAAVAVTVVDNDPKCARRFADDSTVYDSLSFGGRGRWEGVGGVLLSIVLARCSHDK